MPLYIHTQGTDLHPVRVVKANRHSTRPMRLYITFEAKETKGHVQTYQTLVRRVWVGALRTWRNDVLKFRVNGIPKRVIPPLKVVVVYASHEDTHPGFGESASEYGKF